MGLAAAVASRKDQPALRRLGKAQSQVIGPLQVLSFASRQVKTFGIETLEGHVLLQLKSRGPLKLLQSRGFFLDNKDLAEVGMGDAGTEPLIQLVDRGAHGDNGRQLMNKAVVQKLVELLFGPGSAGLNAQVIQNEQGGISDLLEKLVVREFAAGSEGGAQMIEEIRNSLEEGRIAGPDAFVGDGGGG